MLKDLAKQGFLTGVFKESVAKIKNKLFCANCNGTLHLDFWGNYRCEFRCGFEHKKPKLTIALETSVVVITCAVGVALAIVGNYIGAFSQALLLCCINSAWVYQLKSQVLEFSNLWLYADNLRFSDHGLPIACPNCGNPDCRLDLHNTTQPMAFKNSTWPVYSANKFSCTECMDK